MSERIRNVAFSTLVTLIILVAMSSAALSYLWYVRGIFSAPQSQMVNTSINTLKKSEETMQRIQNVITTFNPPAGTRWSIVIEDTQTKARAETAPNESFISASLYKLYVAYGTYGRADGQRLALDAFVDENQSRTYEECIRQMIVISDNDCGVLLGKRIGWSNLDGQLIALGLRNTSVNNYQSDGTFEGNKTTTANDVVSFLTQLSNGALLTEASTNRMFFHLQNQEVNDRIPSDVPAGVSIGHKTGNLEHIVHDAGYLFINNQPRYSYAILSDGWKSEFPASAGPVFQSLLGRVITVVTDQN